MSRGLRRGRPTGVLPTDVRSIVQMQELALPAIPSQTVSSIPAEPSSLDCSKKAGVFPLGWDKLPISHSLGERQVIH